MYLAGLDARWSFISWAMASCHFATLGVSSSFLAHASLSAGQFTFSLDIAEQKNAKIIISPTFIDFPPKKSPSIVFNLFSRTLTQVPNLSDTSVIFSSVTFSAGKKYFPINVGWKISSVENFNYMRCLYPQGRFKHVLTKFRALSPEAYHKVILLDTDLLIRHNVDDVFEKRALATCTC